MPDSLLAPKLKLGAEVGSGLGGLGVLLFSVIHEWIGPSPGIEFGYYKFLVA